MHRQFYMGYSYRHAIDTIVPWSEKHGAGFLTNARQRWSTTTDRFNDMWSYDAPHVVDAGGYNVQSEYVTQGGNLKNGVDEDTIRKEVSQDAPFYPWTVEEYHSWLHDYGDDLDWACAMDYACEERFDTAWSVQDRIDATIRNTVRQHNLRQRDGSDYSFLPVLQGRTVDQYVESAKRLESAGVDVSTVGLGTVCRLSSSTEIIRVEHEVRRRTNVENIHGFGVKIDAYKLGARFETADSQAWIYNPSYGNITILKRDGDGGYRIDSHEHQHADRTRKSHSWKAYYAYVNWIINGNENIPESVLRDQEDIDYAEKAKG